MNLVLGADYEKKMAVVGLLKQYAEDRNVDKFGRALSVLLTSPQQARLIREIRSVDTHCIMNMTLPLYRGAGTIFSCGGGGKIVDMPSDCQILFLGEGGTLSIPLRQKVGGGGSHCRSLCAPDMGDLLWHSCRPAPPTSPAC